MKFVWKLRFCACVFCWCDHDRENSGVSSVPVATALKFNFSCFALLKFSRNIYLGNMPPSKLATSCNQ